MKLAITPRYYDTKEHKFIVIERKYYPFFDRFGHQINLIPFMGTDINEYFDMLQPEALVLAGGYKCYTEEIKKFEREVLETALDRKIPILAICCGMWTVNYYFNGTFNYSEKHQCITDTGDIDMKKIIHKLKATDYIKDGHHIVNSFHSKAINKLGKGLKPFLYADDGTIEGVYNEQKRIIGVQFHMENKGCSRRLTKQIMKKFEEL